MRNYEALIVFNMKGTETPVAVSYTHLTLPTNSLV